MKERCTGLFPCLLDLHGLSLVQERGVKGAFCLQAAREINVERVLVSFLFKCLVKKHVSEFSWGRSILTAVEKGICF